VGRKFLLCRPSGGLTDTLCQIETCWRYAQQFGRILAIDASASGLWGDFADFFVLKAADLEVHARATPQLMADLNAMSCCPAALRGRLSLPDGRLGYACRWDASLSALVDAQSGSRLSFDFTIDHPQDVLLHHQAGGGPSQAFALLQRVVLTADLALECRQRLAAFGRDYDAIHIRNSDYRTDWKEFLTRIAPELSLPAVLVCSDDRNVLSYAQDFFKGKRLLASSMPPDTAGKALHTHEFAMSPELRRRVVRDGLIDLIALARGATLHYTNTTNGYPSGYSELARHLHLNRAVLESLIGA